MFAFIAISPMVIGEEEMFVMFATTIELWLPSSLSTTFLVKATFKPDPISFFNLYDSPVSGVLSLPTTMVTN